MKKIFSILFTSFILLTLTSCNNYFTNKNLKKYGLSNAPRLEGDYVYNIKGIWPEVYAKTSKQNFLEFANDMFLYLNESYYKTVGYEGEGLNNFFGAVTRYELIRSTNLNDYKEESEDYIKYRFIYALDGINEESNCIISDREMTITYYKNEMTYTKEGKLFDRHYKYNCKIDLFYNVASYIIKD